MKNELDALEWLKLNEYPYWRVTEKDSSKSILASKENEENEHQKIDVQDSCSFFEKGARLLPDGLYVLYGRRNVKGSAGEKQYIFSVNESKTPKPTQDPLAALGSLHNIHASHIGIVVDYERKLSEERNRYNDLKFEKELRIKDLETQLKEAKKEDNTLEKIAQIAGLADRWFGGSPSGATVSGTEPTPKRTNQQNPSNQDNELMQRIGGAINTIADIIKDDTMTVEAFENLAKFAQKNPTAFLNYLEFLKRQ